MASTDAQQVGQNLLYPINDPEAAFGNAIRQRGWNPSASNPFMDMLKQAARGSQIAFLSDNVRNTNTGENPSQNYGQWLGSAMNSGNLFNKLRSSASGIYGTTKALDDYTASLASGGSVAGLSPYASALKDIFAAKNGGGAMDAYSSLVTPNLGSLGRSYNQGLQAREAQAQYNYAQNPNPNVNMWNWVLGQPGSGNGGGLF